MSQPSTRRTLVIGEALVDVVHELDGSVAEHVGGSPLNVAMGLARLGHPAVLATHLARDTHGRLITDLLTAEHVEITEASFDLKATSTAQATLHEDGAATYEFQIDWPDVTGLPENVGHVHAGSIGAFLAPGADSVTDALARLHNEVTTSFDPNVRPTLMGTPETERTRVERTLAHVDVAKSSDEDAHWLYPDMSTREIAEHWATLGPRIVVITRGGDGALVLVGSDGGEIDIAGRRVDVADTVGAGDSFMSGFISGLLDAGLLGGTESRRRLQIASVDAIRPALERAVLTSSITVTRHGSNPPTRVEIDAEN